MSVNRFFSLPKLTRDLIRQALFENRLNLILANNYPFLFLNGCSGYAFYVQRVKRGGCAI